MNKLVSFELAKLLKEKGFDKKTLSYYFEDGEFRENQIKDTYGYYGDEYVVENSEFLENWNDKWLTRKNGDRCFGCQKSKGYLETFSAPTIAEVVMWLYEKHSIWIEVRKFLNGGFYANTLKGKMLYMDKDSPTESYEAAIEYCLKNLL